MSQISQLNSNLNIPQRALGMQTDIEPSIFMSDLPEVRSDSVTLRSDEAAAPAGGDSGPKDMVFSFNPQDRRVMEAGTTVIKGVTQGARGPETDKVKLMDGLEPENGKFVFPEGDVRRAKAQTFAGVARAVNLFKEAYGDFNFSFEGKLGVFADAGKMLQGFYKREQQALIFYRSPDPIFGNTVYSGASNDVASHEAGHAILDGIRPNYYLSVNPEPRAFHEAFGDVMAIHSGLCDDRVIARVAVQTGGDLGKPNVVAMIAEEMGMAVNNDEGSNVTGGDYLRNANNDFRYEDPSKLPEKSPNGGLSWNRHSFSRVWTGAHFDLLKAMVKDEMAAGKDTKAAIKDANAELLRMTASMLKEAPHNDFTYKEMAQALLLADAKHHQGKHLERIKEAFVGRNILPADVQLPEVPRQAAGLANRVQFASLFEETAAKPQEPQTLSLRLDDSFGQFCGAYVEMPVDADLTESEMKETQDRTLKSMRSLVQAGRVRYNDPHKQMSFPDDYISPQGEPYTAAVFWESDKMVIRALPFTLCDHGGASSHQHGPNCNH